MIAPEAPLATLSYAAFAARVLLALVFGALIGFERQWRQRMAGLRTNAVGAATIGAVRASAMTLVAVYSEDIGETGRVAVTADASVGGRPDALLEKDRRAPGHRGRRERGTLEDRPNRRRRARDRQ